MVILLLPLIWQLQLLMPLFVNNKGRSLINDVNRLNNKARH